MAKMGAIVESAPTDICRVDPKIKMATDPAMKAYIPNSAGMFASLAVAICSGIAIEMSAIAATRSRDTHEG